jgi:hypothetical protein
MSMDFHPSFSSSFTLLRMSFCDTSPAEAVTHEMEIRIKAYAMALRIAFSVLIVGYINASYKGSKIMLNFIEMPNRFIIFVV